MQLSLRHTIMVIRHNSSQTIRCLYALFFLCYFLQLHIFHFISLNMSLADRLATCTAIVTVFHAFNFHLLYHGVFLVLFLSSYRFSLSACLKGIGWNQRRAQHNVSTFLKPDRDTFTLVQYYYCVNNPNMLSRE